MRAPESEHPRRLLVTGGAGFIGSRLCEVLLRRGDHVVCVDNLSSSTGNSIRHLLGHERFRLIRHDVSTPLAITEPLDFVLHLATTADPEFFRTRPVDIARAAALGTLNLLDVAREHRARFLLASSDAVYGDPLERRQSEGSFGRVDPVGPRSAYDEGKRFSESLTMAYQAQWGVNTGIARIFHTYGERMPADGRLIPTFIDRALRGAPLVIMGTGEQTRSFCHFADLVEGIVLLMHSDHHGPVNLGNPREISVLSLAELIIGLAESASRIQFTPALAGDRPARCPNISLATQLLGWSPGIDLEWAAQDHRQRES